MCKHIFLIMSVYLCVYVCVLREWRGGWKKVHFFHVMKYKYTRALESLLMGLNS